MDRHIPSTHPRVDTWVWGCWANAAVTSHAHFCAVFPFLSGTCRGGDPPDPASLPPAWAASASLHPTLANNIPPFDDSRPSGWEVVILTFLLNSTDVWGATFKNSLTA